MLGAGAGLRDLDEGGDEHVNSGGEEVAPFLEATEDFLGELPQHSVVHLVHWSCVQNLLPNVEADGGINFNSPIRRTLPFK